MLFSNFDKETTSIAIKVIKGERINNEEGIHLLDRFPLSLLCFLADYIKRQKTSDKVYYIKNAHLEPSNKCVYNCKFCSFSYKKCGYAWEYSIDELMLQLEDKIDLIEEVHITGAAHPDYNLNYYTELFKRIKEKNNNIHIKALSAVEIIYLRDIEHKSIAEVIDVLKNSGLGSIPGGGAEILDDKVRAQICFDKCNSEEWLEVHRQSHIAGLKSNATILYGHIEQSEHIINHLAKLRDLQDETSGFNAFIPLKFKNTNNLLSHIKEVDFLRDIRVFATSRIFLDNICHIKSYWPMLGKDKALLMLNYGADDIDGTINNSTKIFSLSGADEKSPNMSESELILRIENEGFVAQERDSEYEIV